MEEQEYITFALVRTPSVDKLLKDNGQWVANNESSNMSEGISEEMKCRAEALDQELDEIQQIQSELLEMMEKAGYDIEEVLIKIKAANRQ